MTSCWSCISLPSDLRVVYEILTDGGAVERERVVYYCSKCFADLCDYEDERIRIKTHRILCPN